MKTPRALRQSPDRASSAHWVFHRFWRLPFCAGSLLLLLAPWQPCRAAFRVPEDFPTIAQALAHAMNQDTVLVACGTYYENYLWLYHGATLRSETGDPNCVIIDGEHERGTLGSWNASPPGRIEGITFTRAGCAHASCGGSAIHLRNASLAISNCRFISNWGASGGGGINAEDAEILIDRCEFIENFGTGVKGQAGYGGAIRASNCALDITSTRFIDNRGGAVEASTLGGAIYAYDCWLAVEGCEFTGNRTDDYGGSGGAIYSSSTDMTITGSSFEGNWTYGDGGAIAQGSGSLTITGTRFVTNSAATGGASLSSWSQGAAVVRDCYFVQSPGPYLSTEVVGAALEVSQSTFVAGQEAWQSVMVAAREQADVSRSLFILEPGVRAAECHFGEPTFSCCDLYSPTGDAWIDCYADQLGLDGNISADPQFCGVAGSANYYLQSDSPCAPANNSCGELIGALPVGCEAVATKASSISAIKSLY